MLLGKKEFIEAEKGFIEYRYFICSKCSYDKTYSNSRLSNMRGYKTLEEALKDLDKMFKYNPQIKSWYVQKRVVEYTKYDNPNYKEEQ